MKIEFWLPSGGNGMPATMHSNKIHTSVKEWCNQQHIDFEYVFTERKGYKYFVKFPNTEDYLIFKLTYTEHPFKFNYDDEVKL
jgi:hypothetical protein